MSDDYKVQWSIKMQNQDLVNVRADDPTELKNLVTAMAEEAPIISAMADVIRAEGVIVAVMPGTTVITPAASGGKMCAHGVPFKFKEGGGGNTGKKRWSGLFCAVPKGTDANLPNECDPIWDRN